MSGGGGGYGGQAQSYGSPQQGGYGQQQRYPGAYGGGMMTPGGPSAPGYSLTGQPEQRYQTGPVPAWQGPPVRQGSDSFIDQQWADWRQRSQSDPANQAKWARMGGQPQPGQPAPWGMPPPGMMYPGGPPSIRPAEKGYTPYSLTGQPGLTAVTSPQGPGQVGINPAGQEYGGLTGQMPGRQYPNNGTPQQPSGMYLDPNNFNPGLDPRLWGY